MHMDAQVVTLVFTIVTGIGVLLQAAVLFAIFLGLKETGKKLREVTERLEGAVTPLVSTSRNLVEDISPKIKHITTNLVGASDMLRKQAEHVGTVVTDVTTRSQKQTARVDSMISGALDSIGSASAAVEKTIAAPLRKFNGMLAGLRAGVDTLRTNQAAPAVRRKAPPAASPVTPAASVYTSAAYTTPMVTPEPADVTPEEAREAAARFVRDRAAAAERR